MTRILPTGWVWATFDEVAEIESNLVDPSAHQAAVHVAPNHIAPGVGRLLPTRSIAEDGVTSPKHSFSPGHILYSKIRPYMAKAVLVDFPGLCSADMYPIRAHVDPRFLLAWMLSDEFTAHAAGQQGRSLLPKINQKALSRLPVPVPPLPEQQRIAEAIDQHLSALDVALRGVASLTARMNALRASILRRVLAQDGEPTITIGEVALVSSGATPAKSDASFYEGGTIPWVTSGDLNERMVGKPRQFVTQKALESTSLRVYPAGTVLVAMYGEGQTRGRAARLLFPATTNQACAALRVRPGAPVSADFLHAFLDASYQRNRTLSSGGVQTNLSARIIKEIRVPLRSQAEQAAAVLLYEDYQEAHDRLQADLRVLRSRLDTLRRSVVAAAFSGRLTSRYEGDEPAELLLTRIRTTRRPAQATDAAVQLGTVKRGRKTTRQESNA